MLEHILFFETLHQYKASGIHLNGVRIENKQNHSLVFRPFSFGASLEFSSLNNSSDTFFPHAHTHTHAINRR